MTPLIRDSSRLRVAQRTLFAFARSIGFLFAFVLLFITGSHSFVAAPWQFSGIPSAKPAPVPAGQQSLPASTNPSPASSAGSTPLQKAVHQKKVITEDDLAKPTKAVTLNDLEGEENNPMCDLSCEAELRAEMGFGPEREAEFRNQLTLARHEISYDKIWNSHLQAALEAAGGYCDIQHQKAQILNKGAVSPYIRDNVNSRFAERERKLVLQYRESTGLLTQRVEAIQRFAPFRASVMQHQMSETAARVCPDYPFPTQ
jgi:hypothetical protein